jgi:molecular chaperone DnaK (HSP70)
MAFLLRVILAFLLCGAASASKKKSNLIPVIDIGDEFMKVAIINPLGGEYPLLDIGLNEQSERKTSVVVGFEQDGEIRIGEEGVALKVRAPKRCLYGFLELLGAPFDGPVVAAFLKENPQFNGVLVATERNTAAFKVFSFLSLCVLIEGPGS